MDREPPPVTVTAPGPGGPPPDLLEGGPAPSRRPWPTRVLVVAAVLAAVAVLATSAVRGADQSPVAPPTAPAPLRTVATGITASASLAGAVTDQPYDQRLTLTVDLPAFDGRGERGGRQLGEQVVLVDARVRGFTVEPDDPRPAVPLGRFGRSSTTRSTTVPATVSVDDCSIEPQARRDIVLTVRTGGGPDGAVRAVADADVVRALDRLVSRTCRRPRG